MTWISATLLGLHTLIFIVSMGSSATVGAAASDSFYPHTTSGTLSCLGATLVVTDILAFVLAVFGVAGVIGLSGRETTN